MKTNSNEVPLRYRMFAVKYIAQTNHRQSRIKINDLRYNKSITFNYGSDTIGDTIDQAISKLESLGISVDAMGLADLDNDIVLLSKNMATQIK